jgi:hypothetical protein
MMAGASGGKLEHGVGLAHGYDESSFDKNGIDDWAKASGMAYWDLELTWHTRT